MITGFYTVVSPAVCVCLSLWYSRDQNLLVHWVVMSKSPHEYNQQWRMCVWILKGVLVLLKLNICRILMSLITLFILVSSSSPDYEHVCVTVCVCATNNLLPNYTPNMTWLFPQHKWHLHPHTHTHTEYQSTTKAVFIFSIHFKGGVTHSVLHLLSVLFLGLCLFVCVGWGGLEECC